MSRPIQIVWGCAVGLASVIVDAAPFAYITNEFSNTVSVIDIATNAVVGSPITVGVQPVGVAVNPAGTRVYVTNRNPAGLSTVSVIDTATNTVIATIPILSDTRGVAVNPAGTRVYVTNALVNGSVTVIDATTNTAIGSPIPVGPSPIGIAVNPAGTRVYVANNGFGIGCAISAIDTATNIVIATIVISGCPIDFNGDGPYGVAISPDGSRVYVTTRIGFSVIDTATNTLIGRFAVGSGATGIAINAAGTRLYVTQSYSSTNTVSVIDTATNAVVGSPIAVGVEPEGIAIDPSGTRVLVANSASNTVSVIDTATNTVIGAPIAVGERPRAFGPFIGPSAVTAAQTQVPTLTQFGLLLVSALLLLSAIWFLRRRRQ